MSESSWSQQVDHYCERTDFTFWAEPLNALTNAAFLVAALVAAVAARRARRLDGRVAALVALTAAIGVGSFLFHTFATRWAALADVLPIQLFIVTYLLLVLRRLFGLRRLPSALIGAAFVLMAIPAGRALRSLIGETLGGSAGYLPALAALIVVAALLARRHHPAARALAGAAGLFVISLGFRSLDLPLCAGWPLGTHFLWHLLNGLLLGWLMLALIRYGDAASIKAQ